MKSFCRSFLVKVSFPIIICPFDQTVSRTFIPVRYPQSLALHVHFKTHCASNKVKTVHVSSIYVILFFSIKGDFKKANKHWRIGKQTVVHIMLSKSNPWEITIVLPSVVYFVKL